MGRYLIWLLPPLSLVGLVVGGFVFRAAFQQNQPQMLVMLIFSASMTVMVSLVGLVAFIFRRPGRNDPPDPPEDF